MWATLTSSTADTVGRPLLMLPWKSESTDPDGETEPDLSEDCYLINRKIKPRLLRYREIPPFHPVQPIEGSSIQASITSITPGVTEDQQTLKRSHSVPPYLESSAECKKAKTPIKRQLSDITDLMAMSTPRQRICSGHYFADLDMSETKEEAPPLSIWFLLRCAFWIAFLSSFAVFLVGEFSLRCTTDSVLPHLNRTIFQNVVGQHRALNSILHVWKAYSEVPNTTAPLGLLLRGASGVGKTMVANIIASQFTAVNYIHTPLLPSDTDNDTFNTSLMNFIASQLSKCGPHLFIFDAVDECNDILAFFQHVLNKWPKLFPNHVGRTVFILVATAQHRHMLEYVNSTIIGEKDSCSVENVTSVPESVDFQFEEDMEQANFHVIPFSPLTKSHVKMCIKNELAAKGIVPTEHLVEVIADQMTYLPKNLPSFSKEGCKQVFVKVNLAIE